MLNLNMDQAVSFRTKQEYVYQILRHAIMTCQLSPGEKIVISEVAKQLEVSAIPVREALQLLNSEELVTYSAHSGAIVSPITRNSVVETFVIKEALEGVATREASLIAKQEDILLLKGILGKMDELLESNNFDKWAYHNAEFHTTIVSMANMPTLSSMHLKIVDKWDRIHKYFFSEMLNHRHVQSQEEHYEILSAIEKRDAKEAELLIKNHNQKALADYMLELNSPNDASPK
ncbi:GntR family transcriptional regulator [Pullulanibacillus sp. KACC 23026]|uniref:GntR family transcriptional regulator n=1 Tax=Pullulanibacillus sp. KACC 23026 TaxID=3028315 RepID=UPI0023B0F2C1|nr:GntR family transcriptional regulator [Pullulanibacillus sp. KACC 23026]WEG13696.1 GntR family transcriptional regulator [Pullulanibacillus sp. KACC 23026]